MTSPPISRSNDLRNENRRRVIAALRRMGVCSRAALGEATDLSAAAISSFAADLVAEGVVQTQRSASVRGRPQSTLALAADAATMISLSLSIDHLHLRLIDYAGGVLAERSQDLDTRALDRRALTDTLLTAIDTLARRRDAKRLRQVSVGFQGITSHADGALVWSPILSIGQVPIGAAITDRFGIDASVDNDCRLIALALHAGEPKRLGANFATVLFSHGVGLALTLNDRPFAGIATSALELGHLRHVSDGAPCRCGQRGCIEAYAADYGILRAIAIERASDGRQRAANASATDADLSPLQPGRQRGNALEQEALAAAAGDVAARTAFQAAGSAIGSGLRDLFLLLGPMPVALVGRSPAVIEAMRPNLVAALDAAGPQAGDLAGVPLVAFPDDEALLQAGLSQNALTAVDRQFAELGGTGLPAGAMRPVATLPRA